MIYSDNFDTIISVRAHAEGACVAHQSIWGGYDEFRNPQYDHFTAPRTRGKTKILIVSQPYGIGSRNKALVLAQDEAPFIPEGYVPPRMPPYLFPHEPTELEYLESAQMQQEAISRYSLLTG